MSRIENKQNTPVTANLFQPKAERQQSRAEKANTLISDVLPMAISLGLQLAGNKVKDTKTDKSTTKEKISLEPKVGKKPSIDGASTTAGALSAAGITSNWTVILGGIIGAADIAMNWGRSTPARGAASGTAIGATIGSLIAPGPGTAIGAAIGAISGGLLGSIKTGKHADQKVRDQVRSFLQERGIIDSNYSIGLADGTRFNIGYDGGPKSELGGRRPFETDMNNPLTKYAISWLNPVVAFLSQGNQKIHSDFVGYLANAAISNAKSMDDLKANTNSIIRQFGLDDKTTAKGISDAVKNGSLDEDTAAAWLNGIKERTDVDFEGEKTRKTSNKKDITNDSYEHAGEEMINDSISEEEFVDEI
jgi:hypothetical protein